MYTRQEASLIRKKFWTNFGQYMRPLPGATGEKVNWLNYKTGLRHIYFRLDAGNTAASVAIELTHTDPAIRSHYFYQLKQLKSVLENTVGETWDWQERVTSEDGTSLSRIRKTIDHVNMFKEADWPAIISFMKPRIIALDKFWVMVKDGLE